MTVPTAPPAAASQARVPATRGPVLVVGTGLIGTSIGLGLRRRGVEVLLTDTSPTALTLARDLGAGTPLTDATAPPALVVVAVPPDVAADLVLAALRRHPAAVVTDAASVKVPIVDAVTRALPDARAASRFVGGHPMAGRERSGPMAARADLFDARPWVLTPGPGTGAAAVAAVAGLARDLGAVVAEMTAQEHDEAVALVSHVPQVAASLVAARLRGAGEDAVALAGQGLRDVTRIAASDPALWAQILAANAGPVRRALAGVRADLDTLLGALAAFDPSAAPASQTVPGPAAAPAAPGPAGVTPGALAVLAGAIRDGNEGHRLIPGKHGGGRVEYAVVGVLVPDRPGEIARLLADVHGAGVNLEDIRIEHSLGRPTGLVEIAVAPAAREGLVDRLADRGWRVVS